MNGRLAFSLALTLPFVAGLNASAGTISDGDFSSWSSYVSTTSPYNNPNAASYASSGQDTIVGNPAPSLLINMDQSSGAIYMDSIKTDYVSSAVNFSSNDQFTLSFDAKIVPGSNDPGITVALGVRQGSHDWGSLAALTILIPAYGGPAGWAHYTLTGHWNDGWRILNTNSAPQSGVATEFGLETEINSIFGTHIGLNVDNFMLTSTPLQAEVAAVPEPSTLAGAGLAALAGLGYAWRRRRAA